MSNITYPSTLIPDRVDFVTLSDYGVTVQSTKDFEIRELGSNYPYGLIMSLAYENRTADDVQLITSFYHSTKGSFQSFNFPIALWRHPTVYTDILESILTLNATWRFDSAIQFDTKRLDVYDFNVAMKAVPRGITTTTILEEGDTFFPCNIVT